MIASAVSDEVYQKIMDKETAEDAWNALKVQFEATFKDQLAEILVTGQDVSTHTAKLKTLWNELNNGFKNKNSAVTNIALLSICNEVYALGTCYDD